MEKFKSITEGFISRIVISLAWFYALWVFRIRNRIKIVGRENVPRGVNVLYVSNHQTLINSF
jgi:1-acyl-sn-glycerol-3-phosphate acyltransferase